MLRLRRRGSPSARRDSKYLPMGRFVGAARVRALGRTGVPTGAVDTHPAFADKRETRGERGVGRYCCSIPDTGGICAVSRSSSACPGSSIGATQPTFASRRVTRRKPPGLMPTAGGTGLPPPPMSRNGGAPLRIWSGRSHGVSSCPSRSSSQPSWTWESAESPGAIERARADAGRPAAGVRRVFRYDAREVGKKRATSC